MKNSICVFSLVASIVIGATTIAAQDTHDIRSISLSAFANKRPAEAKGGKQNEGGGSAATRAKGEYRFVRSERGRASGRATSPHTSRKAPPVKSAPADVIAAIQSPSGPVANGSTIDIGVTIWRLRPSTADDHGPRLPVLVGDGTEMWTPVRVDGDTTFGPGDRVRFSVESSVNGYLYIINREALANDRSGDPCMIFPGSLSDDNLVGPGSPVEFPDKSERFPYFKIDPKAADYRGEAMLIAVLPKPLNDLKITPVSGCNRVDASQISRFQAGDFDIFTQPDSVGAVYTKAEADAVCDTKTRQLTREQPNTKPCAEKTRSLTREEPLPQSIYRVKTSAGHPAVAKITLGVQP